MDKKRTIEIISNETKDEICKLDVVTPEIFAAVFFQKAKEYNIENIEEMTKEYFDVEVAHFLEMQGRTTQHAKTLSQTTTRAIEAIEKKNDETLKDVLTETKKLRKEVEKLKESLFKDELTGAYNRKWVYDYLVDENTDLFKKEGVLAVIDLNYFKLVNDTYGHIIGDKVLVFVANQLKKTRAHVIRYGGDEFIVAFENQESTTYVKEQLERLRRELLKKHLKAKDTEFRISFSIGVSRFSRNDTFTSVVDLADQDMYEDKITIKKEVTGIDV